MLEQLFSSRTRVKLLRLFLNHPQREYFTRELARLIGGHLHAVRRELENLAAIGFLLRQGGRTKTFYRVDPHFPLQSELQQLFFRAQIFHPSSALQRLKRLPQIKALVLTGYFTNQPSTLTDVLIVGRPPRAKLKRLIGQVQKEVDRTINYTVLSKGEFQLRQNVTDRFIISILDYPHLILTDSLGIAP